MEKKRIFGIKTYTQPEDYKNTVKQWKDLGINSLYTPASAVALEDYRRELQAAGIDYFLITPVFYGPEALKTDASLFAISANEEIARRDWVEFVCPFKAEYLDQLQEEIVKTIEELQPAGLSLDFMRHFVFWEMIKPEDSIKDMPNTCFCPDCVSGFHAWTGIHMPEAPSDTKKTARWILDRYEEEWTEWKCRLISDAIHHITESALAINPDLKFNLHLVPWKHEDYDNAIQRIAGQNIASLEKYATSLSPMTYNHMLYRDNEWIHGIVKSYNTEKPVIPAVQVGKCYRDEDISLEDFTRAVESALQPPSAGVIFWSWDYLLKEPEKIEVIKRFTRT